MTRLGDSVFYANYVSPNFGDIQIGHITPGLKDEVGQAAVFP